MPFVVRSQVISLCRFQEVVSACPLGWRVQVTGQKQNLPEDIFLSWVSEGYARGGARSGKLRGGEEGVPQLRDGETEVLRGPLVLQGPAPRPCDVTSNVWLMGVSSVTGRIDGGSPLPPPNTPKAPVYRSPRALAQSRQGSPDLAAWDGMSCVCTGWPLLRTFAVATACWAQPGKLG